MIASGASATHPPRDLIYALFIFVFSAVVFLGVAFPFAGIVSLGGTPRMGAHPVALSAPIASVRKASCNGSPTASSTSARKTSSRPNADAPLFKMAPYLVMLAFMVPWAVMPFSSSLILADLNVGILYFTSVTALTVVGVLMAGWASNDKWSLIGGIRSAAQIVSYEIPAGLSIFPVVLMTGTLSMQGIIKAQGWAPEDWFMFSQPVHFRRRQYPVHLGAGRRQPHAVRLARSGIRAGRGLRHRVQRRCATCSSSWRSGATCSSSARLITTLFLGGWQFPHVTRNPVIMNILQLITFNIKVLFLVFVSMWVRGTLPRVRIDQLMSLCWKYFVPISFVDMVGTAVWMAIWPDGKSVARWVMLGAGIIALTWCSSRASSALLQAHPQMELYLSPTI